jgi:hypothetical protein
MKISKADLRKIAEFYVYGAARENAAQTVIENHSRESIGKDGVEYHPSYDDYFRASVRSMLDSLQSEREYENYVPSNIKRPLTKFEVEEVRKMIFE